jgi:TRAP-type C4-dicarboxylate transport system substrate-binding protein
VLQRVEWDNQALPVTRPQRPAAIAGMVVVAAMAFGASACAGSERDKAGGRADGKHVVLTLANTDPDRTNLDSPDFVAAVERLSGHSIRVEVEFGWGAGDSGEKAEERAVADVRAGKVDLAVIPARAWDRLGVSSFRALLAPFLVDSLALQERVLTSPLADRMLKGVEALGLVGIAVLPGELRYPLGISKPLVAARDYRRATVGIRPTPVAERTFRALGATSQAYEPGAISGLDGAELGAVTIGWNRYEERAQAMTANVVFWPRAMTIVMNRRAYDALSEGQRDLLRRAGKEGVRPLVERIQHDTETWLAAACSRRAFSLVHASAAERAALRQAVAPVYDELDRDPLTRELLSEIRQLRGDGPATDVIRCSSEATTDVSVDSVSLQGRWTATLTREELRRSGISPGLAETLRGSWWAAFEGGRFEFRREEGGGGTGTYSVDGDTIRFVWDTGIGIRRGEVFVTRWSIYRDRLRFWPVPGRTKLAGLDVEPFTRVR